MGEWFLEGHLVGGFDLLARALKGRRASPSLRTTVPSVRASSSSNCVREVALLSVACAPSSHSMVSASRPCMAA